MAVDPVTAKIIAKAAVDVLTDQEKRRRVLIVILAPIIGLVLLIALFFYIITSPLSLLLGWLLPNEIAGVEQIQVDYGFNQTLGIYEKDYVDGSGRSYEDITFINGSTEVVYYNQLDSRWADIMYGTSSTIGQGGCGPTSMAIVVSSLTERMIDPVEMSEWSVANGHRCEGNGSYHSLIPSAAAAFGVPCTSIPIDDAQGLVDALSSGKLVVALMAKGHFTSGGHFIVLRGVTEDGKILVADPASHSRSEKEWDISIILDEARQGAAAGGPFWAMG